MVAPSKTTNSRFVGKRIMERVERLRIEDSGGLVMRGVGRSEEPGRVLPEKLGLRKDGDGGPCGRGRKRWACFGSLAGRWMLGEVEGGGERRGAAMTRRSVEGRKERRGVREDKNRTDGRSTSRASWTPSKGEFRVVVDKGARVRRQRSKIDGLCRQKPGRKSFEEQTLS